jgi:hypothetical protein
MFQWYIKTLKYKTILYFQHEVKSSLLNVQKKTIITFIVFHVCVIAQYVLKKL